MKRVAACVAGLLFALLVGMQGAIAATTIVDLGGPKAYVRADRALPLCGLSLFVRAGLDRQAPEGNGLAALVAESILRTPVGGTRLADAVTAHGGSIVYFVSPQYVRFYIEGDPETLPQVAALTASALAHPAFDIATLAVARAEIATQRMADERDPRSVGIEMLRGSLYAGAGAAPLLGSAVSLAALSTTQAQAFYSAWYARGDAFVTVVGRTGEASDAASSALVGALPAGSPPPAAAIVARTLGDQPRRLVTSRDIAVPFVVLGFDAPNLGDPDFAAALVMRALLGDVLESPSASTLPSVLRVSGTAYAYETAPAHLSFWFNGGRVEPTQALTAIDAVLKRVASEPVDAAAIARFRDRARGAWTIGNLTLDQRSWSIGNAVAHGLDADIDATVGDAIAHVTAADVQRVAKKYFRHFDVALVLPRNSPGG